MMKNKLYILVLIYCTSCSLDFPVEDEITGENVIDNVAIAQEALAGVYVAYPKNKINFSKLADDFYPNHTIYDNPNDYQLYNWGRNEIEFFSNSLWNAYYSTISRVNILLNSSHQIQQQANQVDTALAQIKAEALCLKALCFFDLIQIFCETYTEKNNNKPGIIIKYKVKPEELPRSTLKESYQEVERLLIEAISIFPDEYTTNYRFSKLAAKALLTRVYFNWKKYKKAIALSDELISLRPITNESFFNVWSDLEVPVSTNRLVSETFLVMEQRRSYFDEIYDSQMNEDEYYLNPNLIYQENDIRRETFLISQEFRRLDNTVKRVNYLGKFRKEVTDTAPKSIPVLRIAELYFIKAESFYHLSQEDKAKTTINSFLKLRGTSNLTGAGTQLLIDLLHEKQKEFVGEGLRYFDIKRNGLVLNRVNSKHNRLTFHIFNTDYRWVFPIPKTEIQNNNRVINNLGW